MSWWFKIILKLILSKLPISYNVWKKLNIFKHGSMDTFQYPIKVFKSHYKNDTRIDKNKDKLILEIGPGDSLSTAILASCYGLKSILIDRDNFANKDINHYKKFSEYLLKNNFIPADISNVSNIEEMLHVCNSQYLTNGIESIKKVDSGCVDHIFSQAVLEHVRKSEFTIYFEEFFRVLKKNGTSSHQIDLRDHLANALNNLRFSEKLWESNFFANSGFYTNRLGYEEIKQIAINSGFKVRTDNILKWGELPTKKHKFSKQFRSLNEETLKIKVFDLFLEKSV